MDTLSSGVNAYVEQISTIGGEFGPMAVKAAILLVIILFLVKYLGRFVAMLLIKYGMPERKAAYSVTGLHILVLLIGALVVLNLVGFPGAMLFRAIMIIVMVTLAIFIIAKPYIPQLPYRKGNLIQVAGAMGIVDSITIMHTCIRTLDGKIIFVPNHKVLNDQVVNSSARPNRRLDIDFFIPYDQDVDKVKGLVGEILKEDEIVLEKPAPRVVVDKFTPEYMEMKARFWVVRKHALTGRWGLNEKIKSRFDEEGIQMASPRLEITQDRHDKAPASD